MYFKAWGRITFARTFRWKILSNYYATISLVVKDEIIVFYTRQYLLIWMRLFYFVSINYLKPILPRDSYKLIIENAQVLFVGTTLYIQLENVCEK